MCGIAQRVKEGYHVLRDTVWYGHHIACGYAEVFRKRAVTVHAHALCVAAVLAVAGTAVAAVAAYDMAFAGYYLAYVVGRYAGAQLRYLAYVLMSYDHRGLDILLRPLVPVVDVYVSAAYSGLVDLDKHFAHAGHRLWYLSQNKPFFRCRFYQCVHHFHFLPLLFYKIRFAGELTFFGSVSAFKGHLIIVYIKFCSCKVGKSYFYLYVFRGLLYFAAIRGLQSLNSAKG